MDLRLRKNRSHDFDGVNINVGDIEEEEEGKDELVSVTDKEAKSLVPFAESRQEGDKGVFYPKIISSSFVRKTRRKEVDDIER